MADGSALGAAASMRLDRFLWWARLARTRTAAQTLAEDGRLRLDGRLIDRAHVAVRPGNILTYVAHGGRVRVLRVEALPRRRGPPAEAQLCYIDLQQAANVSQQGELD
ncbi:heat-shock protein Hsp15 [Sphingomonas metalli]|jgi:ribosome-associated heat shock protein Hsp15|uniref:Heat-shock protein Hsp15 n=1 Tax=Sphingomonas metalli TaxID=1779358 RepID=A0A916T2Y8_9SPHN|nr:S4 domain-containing protein [Sphingomonas metalli]GGB28716.1 heat-shock protein Hsp15 [Sphingomonas metalli]